MYYLLIQYLLVICQ